MSDSPVFITGHSLGAARAALYAWSRLRRGLRVDGVYLFGCPHPGDRFVAETYGLGGLVDKVKKLSLWNRRDPFPALPIDLEFLGEEYVPAFEHEECNEEPLPLDPWGPFADHHSELYDAAAKRWPKIADAAAQPADASGLVLRLYRTSDGWDWVNPVEHAWCAVQQLPSGAKMGVWRGTADEKDWLDDFDFSQIGVMGARVSEGFWKGVALAGDMMDERLL